MPALVGAFSALLENTVKQSERRTMYRLEQINDKITALCKRHDIDPVNPLGGY